MEILDGPALAEMIFRGYARNPKQWFFRVSPSRSNGFYDAVVGGPDASWQLKLDTIFKPSPLVIGAKTEVGLQAYAVSSPLSFGYRELDPSIVGALGGEEAAPGLAELLATLAPVVPEEGKAYAQGPFVLTRETHRVYDRSQTNIDERLSSEMLRLVRNRYLSYG
jgi:hypothetical protein